MAEASSQGKPEIPYVFSAIGGSGSRYLIERLSLRYCVGDKPDTVFRPRTAHLRIGNVNANQGSFEQRSLGFQVEDGETLESVLPKYLAFIAERPHCTAVLNTSAELGLLSQLGVDNVVFLVRHPLHAYVSWGKPIRHGDAVEYLGGRDSDRALQFYGRRWNNFTDEVLRMSERGILGGLVRYEHARRDTAEDEHLEWVFAEFDSSRRNYGILSPRSETLLRRITAANYFKLYNSWEV